MLTIPSTGLIERSTVKRRFRHRIAKTGRFVSAAFAARHLKTTVREKV
jgi:hypothetical protein